MLDCGNDFHLITGEQVTRFAEALYLREYGKGTIENYVHSIKTCVHWCDGKLSKERIVEWKKYLVSRYAPATTNAMLSGLNCFLRFAGLEGCQVKLLKLQHRSFSDPARELKKRE